MRFFLLGIVLIASSVNASAGEWLAINATVSKVWSSESNQAAFYVSFSEYTGSCSAVTFLESNAQSPKAYSHMFAMAMTAYLTKKKIDVISYSGSSCASGNFIAIHD